MNTPPDSIDHDDRVFFRDIKPYAAPDTLEQLQGPAHGVVALDHSVLWSPGDTTVDLDEPGGVGLAYRAVLAEGTVEDQIAVLHRQRLLEVWPQLLLPARVRTLWERRFPELHSTGTRP